MLPVVASFATTARKILLYTLALWAVTLLFYPVGRMGDVYLGRQKSLDRPVAIKILPPELARDPEYVRRFSAEARAAAKLNHENIVGAVDAGEEKGRYFFAMEYVQGETLQQILKRDGALSEHRGLEIARHVARGLRHAHQQGLIHRDIKSANIMIALDGTAKICDCFAQ